MAKSPWYRLSFLYMESPVWSLSDALGPGWQDGSLNSPFNLITIPPIPEFDADTWALEDGFEGVVSWFFFSMLYFQIGRPMFEMYISWKIGTQTCFFSHYARFREKWLCSIWRLSCKHPIFHLPAGGILHANHCNPLEVSIKITWESKSRIYQDWTGKQGDVPPV